jgi:large subunit ribosomal protein L23
MEKIMNNLGDLLKLIKYPSLTEKSINLYGNRQYTFIVDRTLTKTQIKFIIENIFNVSIIKVNTAILPTKKRRVGKSIGNRSVYKKAYVKLKEGDTINDLFN